MVQTMKSNMMFRFVAGVAIVLAGLVTVQLYQTQMSLAAGNIMLYTDNVTHNGNLGGRAGADALCASSASKPAGFGQYRAFISVDAADEIQDMPTNYGVPTTDPIVGSGGTIATNWANLLDGSIDINLQTAIGATGRYWTGSSQNGGVMAVFCSGWTTVSFGSGEIGDQTKTDTEWLKLTGGGCNNPYGLVCIAYGTPATKSAAVGGVAERISLTPMQEGQLWLQEWGIIALGGLMLVVGLVVGISRKR